MKYKNKLDWREFQLIQDGLLTGMEVNVDYINNVEKSGKQPPFTKGYIVNEYTNLLDKVFNMMAKKDQDYIELDSQQDFIDNVKTKFKIQS